MARYVNVPEVRVEHDEMGNTEYWTPLVPVCDAHFGMTVAYDLLRLGAPAALVRDRYAQRITFGRIVQFIRARGRKILNPRQEERYEIRRVA